jgi:hypothetical protein
MVRGRAAITAFPFYISLGVHVLFHWVAIDIKFLFTVVTEGAENCFLGLTGRCHMQQP